MLLLMRRIGESIIINHNIKITIQEIFGKQVNVSIEAPKEIQILREEIYEQYNKTPSNKKNKINKEKTIKTNNTNKKI